MQLDPVRPGYCLCSFAPEIELPPRHSEWPEYRQKRNGLQDLPLDRLHMRPIDHDNVAGIYRRILRLAPSDRRKVKSRCLALAVDRPEDRDPTRVRVLG